MTTTSRKKSILTQRTVGLKSVLVTLGVALSAHALAGQTSVIGTGSSIFLTVNDTTTGAGYVFDTGLSVTGFTGTTAESYNIASTSAYSTFLSSVSAGDNLEYAVVGAEEPAATTPPVTLDLTGPAAPGLKTYAAIAGGYNEVSTFLGTINNPAGGSSYQSSTSGTGWNAGGYEATLNGVLHATDFSGFGDPLDFYQLVGAGLTGHSNGTESAFAGTWLFANGVLTYTPTGGGGGGPPPPVPLPAPGALLLSGLSIIGLIARRRSKAGRADRAGKLASPQ